MSLIDSLSSKPRWQHRKAEVRRAAVEELDDPEVLQQLVLEDEDPGVRAAALERIADDAVLDRLIEQPAGRLGDGLREQARRQRLLSILPERAALGTIDDPGLLARIASLASDAELVEAAIAQIRDESVRVELATGHPAARARLAAVEGVTDPEALQAVMQQARHKDKAVFRKCREALDALHAAEREQQERREALVRIADEAAILRQAPDTADFHARLRGLQERWNDLAGAAGPELAQRVSDDLEVCARRFEEQEQARRAEAARAAEAEAARHRFGELLEALEAVGPESGESEGPLRAIDRIEEEWVLAQQLASPAEDAVHAFRAALQRQRARLRAHQSLLGLEARLSAHADAAERAGQLDFKGLQDWLTEAGRLESALAWPEQGDAPPAPLLRLQAGRAAVEGRIEELKRRQVETVEKVDQAMARFKEELGTNHYRNADRALDRLRNLLRLLPTGRQARYHNELKPLLVRLQEIHDWQGFAIEPKKRELIEQMRGLVGSDADPDALATRIRALQEEWKQLGPLAPRRDRELWKAFQSASNEAWKPCKQAFSERARERRAAYEQRMKVVEQLTAYEQQIAWPDLPEPEPGRVPPDWKRVRQTLRAARQAFRELSPVDRKQERRSQKALDAVCDRIYAHLKNEYDRNTEARQALVAEARALSEEPDLRRAIDRAKAIQSEWKRVGPVPRPVDQKLWKALRKACDEVFGRLDERREERRAAARADEQRRREREVEKTHRWLNLLARMRACALRTEQAEAAEALWAGAEALPKRIDTAVFDAWWSGEAVAPDEDAWREACIALEVLAGQPSPPEDREARMAYQMQRLVEGMGQHAQPRGELLREAIQGFAALQPPLPWVERFSAAVRSLRGLPDAPPPPDDGGNSAKAPAG